MFIISLEEVTEESFDSLQKSYLKEAAKSYDDESWKEDRNDVLAYIGMTVGSLGTVSTMFTESVWPMTIMGSGMAVMLMSCFQKRRCKKESLAALKQSTSKMSYEDLKDRHDRKYYNLPPLDSDGLKDFELVVYASDVCKAVYEKEKNASRYIWPVTGAGIAAYGLYAGANGSPISGGLMLTAGSCLFTASYYLRKKNRDKLGLEVFYFLKEKGFGFYEQYVRNKDPYDFYTRFMKEKPDKK